MTNVLISVEVVISRERPNIDALPHVIQAIHDFLDYSAQWDLQTAARNDFAYLLRRLIAQSRCIWTTHYFQKELRTTMITASANGALNALQCLCDAFPEHDLDGVLEAAAFAGHLELVQWIYMNQIARRCGRHAGDIGYKCSIDALMRAAKIACLKATMWTYTYPYPDCHGTTFAMDGAATNGHLHVLHWLHYHTPLRCTTNAMDGAARNGHLHIVQWLHQFRNEGCDTWAMDGAAMNGHLEVVQWLHYNRHEGCTPDAMDLAALNGHLAVLQWLHRHRDEGCTWARQAATLRGHHDVEKWLVTHHVPHGDWVWYKWRTFEYIEFPPQ